MYTPPATGFIGTDTFTYTANDGVNDSSVATVTLNVTPRLSIPTTLSGTPGGKVVVPVYIDNPNPAGSNGLTSVELAIDYNPAVLSSPVVSVGTVNSNWTAPVTTVARQARRPTVTSA